ncbi:hypothetical protein TNCV_1414751 [Trichonephila clavipes]|nr:hypothetical protein TNCV_1414751 [Trichonephila clavipes]
MWRYAGQQVAFSEESRFFGGQMITVYGCGERPLSTCGIREIGTCHRVTVHDLELTVQDLWTHLPQDNIRCLINSMPDRVATCIAAESGPTRS